MNIFQRLQATMKEIAYVKKDTTIKDGGGYQAVSHDNVTAHVRPLFLKHGIVMHPTLVLGNTSETEKKTSKGTPYIRYVGAYDVAFVNVDDPTDRAVVHIEAHAEDTGDKAPGKALSYACKYAILKVLMIETGENDESRVPMTGLSEDQCQEYLDAINAAGTVDDLQRWKETAFKAAKDALDLDAHKAFKEAVLARLEALKKAA